MEWYEHLLGVFAILYILIAIPIQVIVIACVIVGARAERGLHENSSNRRPLPRH